MPISEKQKQIMAFPYSKYEALICDGAIRSGKTAFMMLSFVDDAMRRYDGQLFGICGKTVDSTNKNLIQPYTRLTYAKDRYRISWRRTDKLLIVSDGKHENMFEVFGGKDEGSFALIQGRTLAGVLLDEVALQPRSFVEQACARCSVEGSKLWFNCNPASPKHWFYTEWIRQLEKHNAARLHFLLEDNPSLSEQIVNRYKSMYTGVFYDRYIAGKWAAAEGLIYRTFADDPDRYLIDDADEYLKAGGKTVGAVMVGVDFGGTKSATTMKAVLITRNAGEVIVAHEKHITKEIDPLQLSEEYAAFVREVSSRWGVSQTRADSAEQILIRGLKGTALKEKLRTEIKNAMKRPILDRIRMTNLLFAQDRIRICRSCTHMIEAFSDAVYDEKHEDERLDNGTSDIDSLDAFEYCIEPHMAALEAAGFRKGRTV